MAISQNKFGAVICRGEEHMGHSDRGCLLYSFFFFALDNKSGGNEKAARHGKIITPFSMLANQLYTVPSLCTVAACLRDRCVILAVSFGCCLLAPARKFASGCLFSQGARCCVWLVLCSSQCIIR